MKLTSTPFNKANHSLHREKNMRDTRDTLTAVILRATFAVLAVLVLPCLLVPMPANAAGSSDRKDGVPATQAKSPRVPTVQSASDLVVSEERGLLSLTAVSIELPQVLAAMSKASRVPIELIDQAGAHARLTIAFHDKTLQAAVSEVMSALPAGGFASVGGVAGSKRAIYVITKEGAANFRRNAQAMIDRINTGDSPTPIEITEWLPTVAAVGFSIDADGTSIFIVPVLQLMDKNYGTYEASVSSLFRDQSVVSPLRSAMVELIGRHWDYSGSRDSLLMVFDRSSDDVVLQGQIALRLARHGVTIGDTVIDRYSGASPEARFYYAQALAELGRADAIPMLLDDSEQTQNSALRDVAISSLIKLDPCSPRTASVVDSAIHSAKAVPTMERKASDLNHEIIAMHTVMAVAEAEADGSQAIDRMLTIARDDSVAIDVRLTALEALAPKVSAMSPSELGTLGDQLAPIGDDTRRSRQLSKIDQQRMAARIVMLRKLLVARQEP